MFKNILVPLDGSRLAEAALTPAAWLSKKLTATVMLIHVIEANPPQAIHGEHHIRNEDEACDYLTQIGKTRFDPSVTVEYHVHTEEVRNVPRSITSHASEFGSDLIIMCAHGEGGLRDILLGSIAQQVIGMGKTPVLLIKPEGSLDGDIKPFRRLLVGLDNMPEHEASLQVAGELATAINAELRLVNVVQTVETLKGSTAAASKLLPTTAVAMLEMTVSAALDYLEGKAENWRQCGVAVSTSVRRGDIAHELVLEAQDSDCDLIVLGTHGKAGMGAFWSGSVAPKLVGKTNLPLLFVPVKTRS
ncbi:MAG: universal stress protein [Anaerolineales bacterium]